MKRLLFLVFTAAIAALFSQTALAQRAAYDAMVTTHAGANGVPVALVHRVIVRESRYQPALVGHGDRGKSPGNSRRCRVRRTRTTCRERS